MSSPTPTIHRKKRLLGESGQSLVTAYFIIFLFFQFSVQAVFFSYPFRASQVLSLLLFCIAAPFIFRVLFDFFQRSPWWIGIFALYLLLHPIIFMSMVAFGIFHLPSGYGPFNVLISNMSWFMLMIVTMVIYQTFSISNYHRLFMLLFWLILALSFESLISYVIFKLPYCVAEATGEFEGGIFKIRSDAVARLGVLLIPFSATMALLSNKKYAKLYCLAIPPAAMLVMTTMNRSTYGALALAIVGIFSYIVIFLPLEKSRIGVLKRLIIAGVILTLLLSSLFVFASKYRRSFFALNTFWSRTVTWARGVEIGVKHFPVGVGGLSARYNGDETIEFTYPRKLVQLTGDPSGEQQHKINVLNYTLVGQQSHSLHSIQVALFANFGVAGLVLILFLFFTPVVFIIKLFTLSVPQRKNPLVLSASFLAITLLALQPALFMESTHDILWIIMACNFYLLIVYKKIKGELFVRSKAKCGQGEPVPSTS